jgi:predicted DNA-binding transcriptional regulator YafY
MVAAEAHRPLDRVRRKLEETFGGFDLAQTPAPHTDKAEERLIRTFSDAIHRRRVVEIAYQKEGDGGPTVHFVEPYVFERKLPNWYVHTWDRTREAKRSFRIDRMRSAELTGDTYEPRNDFEPDWLADARVARIHYSKGVARWEVERGAKRLVDGSAVVEAKVGSPEWLVGEILSYRGEAVIVEPDDLRRLVARRARSLLTELGLARLRVSA